MAYTIKISANGDFEYFDYPLSADWKWLASNIDAEYIEAVDMPAYPGFVLIVDEEGRLKPNPTQNMIASYLAGQTLVGDVLILTQQREDWFGLASFQLKIWLLRLFSCKCLVGA